MPLGSLAGILLAGLSVDLVTQFTWTQSEPLSLVLVELGVLCLFLFMSNRARRLPAVLAGVAFGMALLTRYAGLGVVSRAVAVVLLDGRLSLRRRLEDSLIVVGCSIGPLLLFLLRNLIVAGDVVNRPAVAWHPPPMETWRSGFSTILQWLLPDRVVAERYDLGSPAQTTPAAATGDRNRGRLDLSRRGIDHGRCRGRRSVP